MTEIPEIVKDAAFLNNMWRQITNNEQRERFIASAILAAEKRGEERERERCAKVAESYADEQDKTVRASAVAAAIRKGSQQKEEKHEQA